MQRINISLDDKTYNTLRAVSFKQKKSMSEIVRDSVKKSLLPDLEQAQLILNAKDESELLEIIEKDEYDSWEAMKQRHQLS